MSAGTPRLRMFAGPNGSGKSELKKYLPPELLGVYLNADDIEKQIRESGWLDFTAYGVDTCADEVLTFLASSSFLMAEGFAEEVRRLDFAEGRLGFQRVEVNAYFASVEVDFIRQKLLEQGVSFTFETVMSHPSKVAVLARAQASGYRTYLYFIATDDPAINRSRVRNRVKQGGHNVPDDKIEKRYYRSLDLLMDAIRHTHRAYVFDNSNDGEDHTWLAEITDGRELEMKSAKVPAWFRRAVLNKGASHA